MADTSSVRMGYPGWTNSEGGYGIYRQARFLDPKLYNLGAEAIAKLRDSGVSIEESEDVGCEVFVESKESDLNKSAFGGDRNESI